MMRIDEELIMEAELEQLRQRLIRRWRETRPAKSKPAPRFPMEPFMEPFFKNPPKPRKGIWIMKRGSKKDGE
jgi:hypothetical protein